MAAKRRSRAAAAAALLGRLRLWALALAAAICVGAPASAALVRAPAGAAAPENSPLGLVRNLAALTVGAERSQAAESPMESGHAYGQLASDCPYATRGSNAARREVMRQEGIPTSQQAVSQSRNASGRSYEYELPTPGGGTELKSVQQQTLDRSHPGQGHWEAGSVKVDPVTGQVRYNDYGRPKLTNDKSKVDY
jgi:hypothetical protein